MQARVVALPTTLPALQTLASLRISWFSARCSLLSRQSFKCSVVSSVTGMEGPKRIAIIGSGNFGSAMCKIIGTNTVRFPHFHDQVKMWVFEEIIDGRKLTEIINTTHENVKYLPNHKLPKNVVAVSDLVEVANDADILVFVVPHQFLVRTLHSLQGKIKPTAIALSLIKGVELKEGGGIGLLSDKIRSMLQIEVSVMMGANLAPEVAAEKFCETTIGCKNPSHKQLLKDLIQTPYFRVMVVEDAPTVELCGALKNIVAVGAGFVDGLGYGDNTKAAVIRIGLMEMVKYAEVFYPGSVLSTFFESCGVADLITTCYGGRNRRIGEAFVKAGNKTVTQLEAELLNGQSAQGIETAREIYEMLKAKGMVDRFPLFVAIHRICVGELPPSGMIDCIREHPEQM